MKKNKLIYGVGVNDADYVTKIQATVGYVNGKQKQKVVWRCPFYAKWLDMLRRCYSDNHQNNNPTYKGCSVCEEWFIFSNFKAWMEKQDWEGNELDKDILYQNNKIYSPETCVFVSKKLNMLLVERGAGRGDYPLGVSYDKRDNIFYARCGSGKTNYVGAFKTPEDAHAAWKEAKLKLAIDLASKYSDKRILDALIRRYT